MPFDINAARKEASDKDIADYLASKVNFDLEGARKSGAPDKEIAEYLSTKVGAPAPSTGGAAATPESSARPSTIDFATEALLSSGAPDLEAAKEAGKETIRTGVPIATAIGAGAIHPGLAPAGYALGRAGVKTFETAIGDRPVEPLSENLKGVAEDYATAGLAQMGPEKIFAAGQGIARAKDALRAHTPAVTQKAAERKAGELLAGRTSEGPVYSKNINEAKQLEKDIPGVKYTRGQRSNDPQAIMQERELAAAKVTATQDVEQRAAANESIRKFFKKNFPGDENVDDVIAALENKKTAIEGSLQSAQGGLKAEAGRLGGGADAQESGQVLRSTLKAAKDETRKKATELYDAVPDVSLKTDKLDAAIKNIGQEFRKSGDSAKDYPGGLIKQISERISPAKETPSKLVDAMGRPVSTTQKVAPEDIGFQELRGFRTQIREAVQDAERGANPNYKLARRLKTLGDSVESTINQMEGAGGEAAKAFREASTFYKEYDRAFRKGAVGEILRPGNQADGFRVANAEVAGRFFKTGKLDAADDFMRSIGDNTEARQAIKDYAAHDLLKTAENPMTGELVNSKVLGWYAKNRPMLDKFGLTGDFSSVVKAQKSVDAFRSLSDTFNKSVASKMLGADSEKALAKAFSGSGMTNSGQTMRNLMVMVKGDKAAENGLKKAFADHLMKQMENTGADLLGNPTVGVATGQKVLAKYAPAIRELYKSDPQKVKALYMIHHAYEILGRNAKSPLGGGSDTAEKMIEAIAQESTKRAEALPVVGKVLKILNAYDRQQVRQILSKAVFDPDYAETLIMATKGAPATIVKRRLNNLMANRQIVEGGAATLSSQNKQEGNK